MEYVINVDNIKCGGCANSVRKGLLMNKNIKSVSIDIETGELEINAAKDLDLESVKSDLRKLGYPEKGTNNDLGTKAKSFVSCAIGRIGK
jgi:copper chaperone